MPPPTSAVREVRVELGLSQRQLAAEAGVDHTYLSRYERGLVTPVTWWRRRVTAALARLVLAAATKENR